MKAIIRFGFLPANAVKFSLRGSVSNSTILYTNVYVLFMDSVCMIRMCIFTSLENCVNGQGEWNKSDIIYQVGMWSGLELELVYRMG